jgi:hypothetical protein
MSGPFIFIATNRLKPGRLEIERKRVAELSAFIEANEPRLLSFNEYVDDAGSEVAVVQVHPDIESMVFHMKLVRERAAQAYAETLDATTGIQIYGTPSEAFLWGLRQATGEGATVSIKPEHLGGFIRKIEPS